jgi:hypothetical protein
VEGNPALIMRAIPGVFQTAALTRAAIVMTALLGSAAQATDRPTAEQVLKSLLDRCEQTFADPDAAVRAMAGSTTGNGLVTPDGTMLTITDSQDLGEGLFRTFAYFEIRLPGGTRQSCSMNHIFRPPVKGMKLEVPNLAEVVGGAAEKVLGGPVTKQGGDVMAKGDIGQLQLWTLDGAFPPKASLNTMQVHGFVSLTLTRETAAR